MSSVDSKDARAEALAELLAVFRNEEAELVAYLANPKPAEKEIVMTWPKQNYLCVNINKGKARPTGVPVMRATVWRTVRAAQATMSKYGPNAMGSEPRDTRFV